MNYYNELIRETYNEKELVIINKFFSSFINYLLKVQKHIYEGEKIKNDKFLDTVEKQEKLKELDKKRTYAHNEYLKTTNDFFELLKNKTGFIIPNSFKEDRTSLADAGALFIRNISNTEIKSTIKGSVRDDLVKDIEKNSNLLYNSIEKIENNFNIKLNV